MKIPQQLVPKYKGCGLAFAAIKPDGTMINFHYCRDIDPNFDDEWSPDEAVEYIASSERFRAFGTFYEEAGACRFSFGMVSCYEFVEL